jgi:hypothetical protein
MRIAPSFIAAALLAGVSAFAAPRASADARVTLHIANGGTDSLIVSLYDRNLRRRQQVLSGQIINGNASISITISADAKGQGHLYWSAMTLDPGMRRCGHEDKRGVNDGGTVQVSAEGACKRR